MILLTDGVGSWNPGSHRCRRDAPRITIYTIGLGLDIDEPQLRSIATGTGGQYFHVANAADLPDVFREIDEETGDNGKDTDGDGLTDCEETEGVHDSTSFSLVFTSDPHLKDTDGDGHRGRRRGQRRPALQAGRRLPLSRLLGSAQRRQRERRRRRRDRSRRRVEGALQRDRRRRARRPRRVRARHRPVELSTRTATGTATERRISTGRAASTRSSRRRSRARSTTPRTSCSARSAASSSASCQRDSVAWLAGNIASGVFGVTDIRDAIGQLFQGEFVGAGLSILSVVPIAGDALSVVAKAVKFIRRVAASGRRAEARVQERPAPVGEDQAPRRHRGRCDVAQRSAGVTDEAFERLGKAGVDFKLLDEAMAGASAVVKRAVRRLARRREILRTDFGGAAKGFKTIPARRARRATGSSTPSTTR